MILVEPPATWSRTTKRSPAPSMSTRRSRLLRALPARGRRGAPRSVGGSLAAREQLVVTLAPRRQDHDADELVAVAVTARVGGRLVQRAQLLAAAEERHREGVSREEPGGKPRPPHVDSYHRGLALPRGPRAAGGDEVAMRGACLRDRSRAVTIGGALVPSPSGRGRGTGRSAPRARGPTRSGRPPALGADSARRRSESRRRDWPAAAGRRAGEPRARRSRAASRPAPAQSRQLPAVQAKLADASTGTCCSGRASSDGCGRSAAPGGRANDLPLAGESLVESAAR